MTDIQEKTEKPTETPPVKNKKNVLKDIKNIISDMFSEKSITLFYRKILVALLLISVGYYIFKEDYTHHTIRGKTMGTSYNLQFFTNFPIDKNIIKGHIEKELAYINKQASTWQKESHISQFNRSPETSWTNTDSFLSRMVSLSIFICKETEGAFDITVAPLIDAWGFDAQGRIITKPTTASLAELKKHIGCKFLQAKELENSIRKTTPKVRINLSAIAKGGAIDEIGTLLEENGIKNYLIEIGGEVLAKGTKGDESLWTVGIETPNAKKNAISNKVYLKNNAIATSGDYRNFFEEDGIRYNHIINPVTGKPVSHNVASVSVLSSTAAKADAWATAFFTMGLEKSLEIANNKNIPALFIIKKGGNFKLVTSQAWKDYKNLKNRYR